ncbi:MULTISPECIES: hypothetical protein [Dickeya]|uniref:Uncharacterized protein n=1 Tax=Dickeya oryzae TaxID=1240404 RepID=A0AB39ICN8_9GAMM|nr:MULTISPECIES: hypothetical protein [Dickeya]MCA6994866.1 hypothetical protein [Dickeya oryzae]MCI4239281.1 hypothetical protein [Dickeya dianthicola]MCI4256839.1 hypothetical protein [Dickeya dianthicola]
MSQSDDAFTRRWEGIEYLPVSCQITPSHYDNFDQTHGVIDLNRHSAI